MKTFLVAWNDIPTVWRVFLIIGLVLAALYLLFLIFSLFETFYFKRRLNKKRRALYVLFAEERRVLLEMFDSLVEAGISPTEKLTAAKNAVKAFEIDKFSEKTTPDTMAKLLKLKKRIGTVYNDSGIAVEKVEARFGTLRDIEAQKRKQLGSYSSDVGGYNYLVKSKLVGPFMRAFGFRPKEKIG